MEGWKKSGPIMHYFEKVVSLEPELRSSHSENKLFNTLSKVIYEIRNNAFCLGHLPFEHELVGL